jgi:hypothetical protein
VDGWWGGGGLVSAGGRGEGGRKAMFPGPQAGWGEGEGGVRGGEMVRGDVRLHMHMVL